MDEGKSSIEYPIGKRKGRIKFCENDTALFIVVLSSPEIALQQKR